MAVGTQRAAIDPGIGDRRHDLLAAATEHAGNDRGRGNAHQQHVVQTHAVEAVLQRQHALDLMRLDHRGQYVAHGQRIFAFGEVAARNVIGHGKDRTKVVRRMTPFGCQPGVVEVEVADQHAQVERGLGGLQFMAGARHTGPALHLRAGHHRPQQARAARELHRQHGAGEAVHQAVAGGGIGLVAVDLVVADVIRDILHDLVVIRPFGRANANL